MSITADIQMRRTLLLHLLELRQVFLLFVCNPESKILGMEDRNIFYSKSSIQNLDTFTAFNNNFFENS